MGIEEVKVRIEEEGNHQSFVHSWLIVFRVFVLSMGIVEVQRFAKEMVFVSELFP